RDRNPTVGTSADEMIISIRVVATADTLSAAETMVLADFAEIRGRLGGVVFGEGDATLQSAAASMLIAGKLTISTAESCTGGLVAVRLTDVAGSSAYMMQGFVTYSNASKARLLGVTEKLIEAHGAVSREVAAAMAENCRRVSGTDYAIGVTGIAGPSGGTAEKPVGLVYVALATPSETIVKELRLGENLRRDQIRDRTVKGVLNLLRLELMR
ncbi:MAG TPA: nicotinamide-nucleotide amidohydrolase family protein, partial [Phycisphaerae bacterium]|nr:nicotinamide-nucleotide amidohydrolase family protein [Phycisphaerae bacterium]